MKIALLTSQFPPIVGGVAKITEMVAGELCRRGNEVEVYTDVGKHFFKHRFPGTSPTEKRGFVVKRYKSHDIFRGYHFNKKMVCDIIKEDYDVIHSYHFGYLPATFGLVASKARHIPHIFTPEYHPPIYGVRRKLLFWSYQLTQGLPLLRFSDRVIALTDYEKRMIMKVGAKKDNISIIPNPVDADFFKRANTEKIRRRYNLKKKVVLYAGGSSKTKGMHIVFKMAENLVKKCDCSFVLLGEGELQESLKRRNRNKDIIFLPFADRQTLKDFYSVADVLAHPSYYEAFGMVLAEAMACEVPIVSTKQGGIPEVVDNAGFVVNYGDWKKFENHVEKLLESSSLRKSIGKAARKRVLEKFDLKPVVNSIIGVYEGVRK